MFVNNTKKQIILVRHAKAVEREDWKWADFDRPLTQAGDSSNHIVANYLRLIGVKPDRIVASPSVRTRETARWLAKKLSIEKVEYEKELYNEVPSLIRDPIDVHMAVVRSTKKSCKILMIVWHNTDISDFASFLSGDTVPSMKKWSVVVLALPDSLEWKNVSQDSARFVYYLTPQFLKLEELAE